MSGGKVTYVECEDKHKLIEFYRDNGFCEFGRRKLDRDEKDVMTGSELIQMIKYCEHKPILGDRG